MGAIGGIIGSLYNYVNYKLTVFRLRFVINRIISYFIEIISPNNMHNFCNGTEFFLALHLLNKFAQKVFNIVICIQILINLLMFTSYSLLTELYQPIFLILFVIA